MNSRKERLDVLHEKDLKQFLINFNLYDALIRNKISCKYCQEIVTIDNIHAILLVENSLEFICNKDSCVKIHLFGETEIDDV